MTVPAGAEPVSQAARAAEQQDWPTVYRLLTEADQTAELDVAALELLAVAAFLVARPAVSLQAWERAYRLRLETDDTPQAAIAAVRVAGAHLENGSLSAAAAWLRRAEQLLEPLPESLAHGFLEGTRGLHALFVGDARATMEHSRRAAEIGQRLGDAGLAAVGMQGEARALILEGQIEEGLAKLDEVFVAAAAGRLDPIAAGYVFCSTVCAAQAVGDYRRSAEWTATMQRWSSGVPIGPFPGRCRVHRAELLRLQGAWAEAESEASKACQELAECGPPDIGWALCELGLVRLRRGDLAGAEEAFRESHERGRVPHPGLALLYFARGDIRRAAGLISAALDDPPDWPAWEGPLNTRLGRALLLPAQVEIALAAGQRERAQASTAELSELARLYPTAAMRAAASEARGKLELAGERFDEARSLLKDAVRLWAEVNAPYETAHARLALARALQLGGQHEAAELERDTARSVLERIGAVLELEQANTLFSGSVNRTVQRTFMFTDIVGSTDLAELLGDEAWENLRSWHDDLIRSLVDEHGGDVAAETGDGFLAAFAEPEGALHAAIAIQRSLAAHRRKAGFAPKVRIGLHHADAIERGTNYSGVGVHAAARIAALAEGEEIVASRKTAESAQGMFAVSDARQVRLKGISQPVEVVSIDWR